MKIFHSILWFIKRENWIKNVPNHFSLIARLSERSPFDGSCCGGYTGGDDTSSDSEPPPAPRYRIVLLGDAATGKTGEISLWQTNCCIINSWLYFNFPFTKSSREPVHDIRVYAHIWCESRWRVRWKDS